MSFAEGQIRSLLDSYEEERVPVGQQVVQRATKSLDTYGPILDALGLVDAATPEQGIANMNALKSVSSGAIAQRQRLYAAIAAKDYEYNAQGVEMNQRYRSSAILSDDLSPQNSRLDEELYCIPSTSPGARLPHAWIQRKGEAVTTLDLVGKGKFSVITGIGGNVWVAAANSVSREIDLPIEVSAIGAGCSFTDLYGEWNQVRETEESGCLLIRPDGYVAWRAYRAPVTINEATEALSRAFGQILGRTGCDTQDKNQSLSST